MELPKDLQDTNWFSAPSALRVYGQYLNLDKDHNGMLNKEELAGWGFFISFINDHKIKNNSVRCNTDLASSYVAQF